MNFQVPQFIEHEAKIVGPFTLKQFMYVGAAGGISLVLYFSAPRLVFILGTIVLGGISLALAFIKIGGRSLPTYLKNSFVFLFRPKVYLWQQKGMAGVKILKEEKKEEEKEGGGVELKIAEKSRLKNLATKVETRLK